MKLHLYLLLVACVAPCLANSNADDMNAIRDQGFNHSQVMSTLQHLTDDIGPRLTGSPQMQMASKWTVEQLKSWGMSNVHLEGFEFGRGWSYSAVNVNLLSPRATTLHAIPVAWTPGTSAPIEADVVFLDAVTTAELLQYHGKIAGKIVLIGEPEEIKAPEETLLKRYSDEELSKMAKFDVAEPASNAHYPPDDIARARQYEAFVEELARFLKEEDAKAVIYRSWHDGGLVGVFGQNHRLGKTFPVPAVVMSAEHYNLLARLLEKNISPRLSLSVAAQFFDGDSKSYNTIAEIPGRSKSAELVMLGGHLDSWHASTGGVDNGAGVAVAMEAMRILKAIHFVPKRTVRLALWSGEEQGIYGSRHYIEDHFATRPKPTDPKERELDPDYWTSPGWPISKLPDFDRFSVYFNVDNGSGKFRGIYTEGNVAAKAIFTDWFSALSDLSDGTVSTNSTDGTDHESFDDVGLPGFQFIQDELDYDTRLHHTDVDSFDHVLADDVKQAAVVLATFVYNAANADQLMPRKPMPVAPSELEEKQERDNAAKRQRIKDRKAHIQLSR